MHMLKKILSYALGALLALSPLYSAAPAVQTPAKEKSVKNYCLQTSIGDSKVYAYLLNPTQNRIKVISAAHIFAPKEVRDKTGAYVCEGRTLEQIVARYEEVTNDNVLAAINASYFDPQTYRTVGLEVVDGRLIKAVPAKALAPARKSRYLPKFPDYDFKFRASFYLDSGDTPHIGYIQGISAVKSLIIAGPMLVKDGKDVWLESCRKEMFSDYYKQRSKHSAIAITANGNVLMVAAEAVTLDKLADFLIQMGVRDAMRLDSGSSAQLLQDKRSGRKTKDYLTYGTRRNISNCIAVIEK